MVSAEEAMLQQLHGCEDKFPRQLAASFPHILRGILERWHDSQAMNAYFDELMISKRYDRQGFPEEVAQEIMTLRLA